MRCLWIIAIGALTLNISAPVNAEPVYNKPVYNPTSKSYFELYSPDADDPKKRPVSISGGIEWIHAARIAHKKSFRGTRGRLAIVNTQQIHEFLRDTFDPAGAVWIGLRYWCRYNKLQWVNGKFHPFDGFHKWGRHWNQNAAQPLQGPKPPYCPRSHKKATLGVHYWGTNHGFFWNANGTYKQFNALFIEYPTGKK